MAEVWAWIVTNREGLVALAALASPFVAVVALFTAPRVQLKIALLQHQQAIEQVDLQRRKLRADLISQTMTKDLEEFKNSAIDFIMASNLLFRATSIIKNNNNATPKLHSETNEAYEVRRKAHSRMVLFLDSENELEEMCRKSLYEHGIDKDMPSYIAIEEKQIQLIRAVISARELRRINSVVN